MAVQLITYDLRKPGRDYAELFKAIQALGPTWHCIESVWLVSTHLTSGQIRDYLKPHVHIGDKLFVAHLGGNWSTWSLSKSCTDWLRKYLMA